MIECENCTKNVVHELHGFPRIKKFHEEYCPRIRQKPDTVSRITLIKKFHECVCPRISRIALINIVLDFKDYQVYGNNGV